MKILFYKTLLKRARNITPNERILYSFLVSKSISRIDDIYNNKDGCLGINLDILEDYFNEHGNWFELYKLNHTKLSLELNMSRPTIINGLRNLESKGYIDNKYIYVNRELITHGYFELKHCDVLTGETLIFYSWMLDKSKSNNNYIFASKAKMGESLNKSFVSITKMINSLYRYNLIERLSKDILLIKE